MVMMILVALAHLRVRSPEETSQTMMLPQHNLLTMIATDVEKDELS
jgi:hypothetical protein